MPTETYPVGTIVPHGGSSIPGGWLKCDGQAVSRTGRADLFAVIGTDYGVGDGSTTFNVPDMRLFMAIGATAIIPGTTGGALGHVHSSPSHPHTATQPSAHGTHATGGGHTHDAHTTATRSVGASSRFNAPATHSGDMDHAHDAHSAHSGFAITDGGSGNTGGNNPPVLGFDYIIASFNTHLVTFDIRSDHLIADSLRARVSHLIRQDHVVAQGAKVVVKTFDVRSDHVVDFDELLILTRTFDVRQDHLLSRTLTAGVTLDVRSDHVVALARSLNSVRSFSVRSDHVLTRSLGVSVSHDIRSDHHLSIDRSLVLSRTFSIRSNHILSVDTAKIFVRSFSARQNHLVTTRICLDTEDLPDPGAGGGTTIIKRLFIFDD